MADAKLDEVDGEVPTLNHGLGKHTEVEKSLPDSGMDDGSNTCSLENEENSDDDEVITKKPKKQKHQILDDDSDISQDAPATSSTEVIHLDIHLPRYEEPKEVIDLREKRKSEFTPEQVLDQVMADSSDDGDNDDDDSKPVKKKRVKRPVVDNSSDDENDTVMDAIRKCSAKNGTDDLFDNEETAEQKAGSDSENEIENKPERPKNLFDEEDSDSSGCKSSGSEVEKSDNEQQDEGFDETSIDPKLLAKLKKGAAKKPRSKSSRSKDEKISLHSESQRLVRESRVNIPYHQPAPKSINAFLERANKKQLEYKVLKGFRHDTKAKLIQDILEKTRLQSNTKTQEELDKYSDSDEDWNPDEERERTLKEKIDEKIKNKAGSGMPLREIKLGIDSENSNQSSVMTENDRRIADSDNDDNDDLPDIDNEPSSGVSDLKDKESCVMEESEEGKNGVEQSEEIAGEKDIGSDLNSKSESVSNENEIINCPNDLLFDWEKPETSENKVVDENNENVDKTEMDTCSNGLESLTDDNKENIDPNKSMEDTNKEVEKIVTPNNKKSASPSSSAKKKRKKIAALAGIDLDSVKPCLSGNVETFITLEEEQEAPKHPGVQKLMDRLSKHSTKVEKKHKKDTDISVITKDSVGIEQEELKLNTFTYHSVEEDVNPLMKLEAPGAKLVALKEQLKEKMKARREIARQKRQEVYNLDNEEGGFDAEEEEEMSEHSDTDVDDDDDDDNDGDVDDDFEEQFGTVEDEYEEDEKEKNPFADDEAEDDDDDGDNDEDDNSNDGDDDDDEFNLKLDVSDEENSETEDTVDTENNESSHKNNTTKQDEFKEPQDVPVPDKPFSMFGIRGRENSLGESQFQSAQTKVSNLPLPVEDSMDLYGTILPATQHTQAVKPTQASQDFNFLLEDSQSNMLDAEGYLKTKSTGKKKKPVPMFVSDDTQSQNMDEILGLCSGKFMDTQADVKDKSSRKNLFDDGSMSNTQGNMEELMGLCSGVFVDKSDDTKESKKRKNSDVDSDDDDDDDSIAAVSDNDDDKIADNGAESNDENGDNDDNNGDDDTDHLDSDNDDEKLSKFGGFTVGNKHGKIRNEFVEAEAELSGSEYDSDENLDLAEEDDIMEIEEGDAANINEEQLRDEVGRVHLKQLIDEDKRELLRYQEMYLQDGDLHNDGTGRMRRFRWSNINDDASQQDMFNDDSGGEEEQEDVDDYTWRKERFEREKYLKEQQEKEVNEADNSMFLKLGQVFLKKQGSVDNSNIESPNTTKESRAETPGFPGSFYKLSQQKRGSFLARSKEALAKIAEMTKPAVNPSSGAKSSGKFTFNVISPDKQDNKEEASKGKQRKAHASKQAVIQSRSKQPPAKRPKLDSHNSFTQNSIFNHI